MIYDGDAWESERRAARAMGDHFADGCDTCRAAGGVLEMCDAGGKLYHDYLVARARAAGFDPELLISVRQWRAKKGPPAAAAQGGETTEGAQAPKK